MTDGKVFLEPATAGDLAGIVRIYNCTAARSIANCDTRSTSVSPSLPSFEQHATGRYPLLVARQDGDVLGYAASSRYYSASSRYQDHEEFAETVEVSVAVNVNCRGQGIGTQLYEALFSQLRDQPAHVALAGIALSNDASFALHRKFGFTDIGTFRDYACKGDRYISRIWMQRLLDDTR